MFSDWSSLSLQAADGKERWLAPINTSGACQRKVAGTYQQKVAGTYCGVERDLDVGYRVFYCPGAMNVCLKNSRES